MMIQTCSSFSSSLPSLLKFRFHRLLQLFLHRFFELQNKRKHSQELILLTNTSMLTKRATSLPAHKHTPKQQPAQSQTPICKPSEKASSESKTSFSLSLSLRFLLTLLQKNWYFHDHEHAKLPKSETKIVSHPRRLSKLEIKDRERSSSGNSEPKLSSATASKTTTVCLPDTPMLVTGSSHVPDGN